MASVFQRGNSWVAKVKHPAHCWCTTCKGGNALPVWHNETTPCADEVAAKSWADRRQADLERQCTLAGMADLYIDHKIAMGCSRDTVAFYQRKLQYLIAYYAKNADQPISYGSLLKFIKWRKEHATKLRNTSILKELKTLSECLLHAKRLGLWDGDVAATMPELPNDARKGTRWLTREQFTQLLTRTEQEHRQALYRFFVSTGARSGEAMRAHPEDINLSSRPRLVTGGVVVPSGFVLLRGTKTAASWAILPLPPFAKAMLEKVLTWAEDAKLPWTEPMFRRFGDCKVALRNACLRAGLPPCSPNDLRRTTGKWIRQLYGLEAASFYLRHTTVALAESTYAKLEAADIAGVFAVATSAPSPHQMVPVLGAQPPGQLPAHLPATTGSYAVPRDGIEPPTRGFSSRPLSQEKQAVSVAGVAPAAEQDYFFTLG